MTAASAEMLGNGVTTSVEMYFHPERIAAAVGRDRRARDHRDPAAAAARPAAVRGAAAGRRRAGRRARPATAPSSTASARTPPTPCRCRCCARRGRRGPRARPAAAPARRRDRDRGRRPARRARAVGARAAGRARRARRPGARPRTACTWTTATSSCGGSTTSPSRTARPATPSWPAASRRLRDMLDRGIRVGHGHRRAGVQRRPRPVRRPPARGVAGPAGRPVGDRADRRRGVLAGHRCRGRRRSAGRTSGSSRRAGAPTWCTSTPATWCSSRSATRATCWRTWSGPARAGTCATSGWAAGRWSRDGASTTVDAEALRRDVAAAGGPARRAADRNFLQPNG